MLSSSPALECLQTPSLAQTHSPGLVQGVLLAKLRHGYSEHMQLGMHYEQEWKRAGQNSLLWKT